MKDWPALGLVSVHAGTPSIVSLTHDGAPQADAMLERLLVTRSSRSGTEVPGCSLASLSRFKKPCSVDVRALDVSNHVLRPAVPSSTAVVVYGVRPVAVTTAMSRRQIGFDQEPAP